MSDSPVGSIWSRVDAVLFDLDGVITPTADVHQRAWVRALDHFAATESDYHEFIDGRPRLDGIRRFLESRQIVLPEGASGDQPSTTSVHGISSLKNGIFLELLENEPFSAYEGSVSALDLLDQHGVPFALVTSSKNSRAVLAACGLTDRFEIIVDGNRAEQEQLRGKPSPDTYLFAAAQLNMTPDRCAVVEDAVSGVSAGRAGNFALVLGIDRGAGRASLLTAGADLVVEDLRETLP